MGNILIKTQNSGKIDYKVHLEADASQNDAKQLLKNFIVTAHTTPEGVYFAGRALGRHASGRLWVTVEVNVPKNFNLDIITGGGNIEAEELERLANAGDFGRKYREGNVGGAAQLSTDGGHITVKNVAGELVGEHREAGTSPPARLPETPRCTRAAGTFVWLRWAAWRMFPRGGGNVSVEHSGSELVAETAGGQIEVGETAGLVQARTGGGGIRVVRVSGPTDLQTSGGSIYLTQVDSAVKASTGAGGITAWFVTPAKKPGQCELRSGEGDIVVYIPAAITDND